jgi:uncharacterized protein (DUF3084 family)
VGRVRGVGADRAHERGDRPARLRLARTPRPNSDRAPVARAVDRAVGVNVAKYNLSAEAPFGEGRDVRVRADLDDVG